jgi:hypothetical protein
MYHLFQGLRPIVGLLHAAVVLLALYWTLTLIEGATFWGSAKLDDQALPALFLAMGFGLLALWTDWLIRYRRPLLSQLRANRQAMAIYLWRSYLIPLIPILMLPMAYAMWRQRPLGWANDLPALLLMSLILLMLFSLVNQLALARYFLVVHARATAIAKLHYVKLEDRGEAKLEIRAGTKLEEREDAKPDVRADTKKAPRSAIKLELKAAMASGKAIQEMPAAHDVLPAGNASELAAYRAFILQDHRVIAYDEKGGTVQLRFRSLRKVKRELQGDARFFMKGSWILRYDALDRQELIPETRAKKLYLKQTSNYFVLNKNDVGDFAAWLNSAPQT